MSQHVTTDAFQGKFLTALRAQLGWWVAVIGGLSSMALWLAMNVATVSDVSRAQAACDLRIEAMQAQNKIEFAKATDVADKLGRLETTAQNQEKLLKEIRDTLRGYEWGAPK